MMFSFWSPGSQISVSSNKKGRRDEDHTQWNIPHKTIIKKTFDYRDALKLPMLVFEQLRQGVRWMMLSKDTYLG